MIVVWDQSAAWPANMIKVPFGGRLYSSPGVQYWASGLDPRFRGNDILIRL